MLGIEKMESVDEIYRKIKTPSMTVANTEVAAKEKSERFRGLEVENFYHTLTPKDLLAEAVAQESARRMVSLSPNSKTTSSYQDSESLGFALSERKKAH